jgi:hypothetical protein
MEFIDIKRSLNSIGLALNVCNNTITTDDIDAKPDDNSWRINHSEEIALLNELEKGFANNTDTCPLCGCHSKSL